jgi:hypothetical protein
LSHRRKTIARSEDALLSARFKALVLVIQQRQIHADFRERPVFALEVSPVKGLLSLQPNCWRYCLAGYQFWLRQCRGSHADQQEN